MEKSKTFKLLEENMGKYLYDLGFGKNFLNKIFFKTCQ